MSQTQVLNNDLSAVIEVLHCIASTYVNNNLKIQRLGHHSKDKRRPNKITFRDDHEVLNFIKNARFLCNSSNHKNISISFDKTHREMDFYKQLKE